ncbi:cation:proton antiporter regulatory subunit, partial [Bacillus subtilis]
GQEYHVTVIAIVKKNQDKQLNPSSETVIDEGDTLVISGEGTGLKRLIREKLTAKGA